MAGTVDRIEIERDEFGPDVRRTTEPVEHRVHPLRIRHLHAEGLPVARQRAVGDRAVADCGAAPGDCRTGPEHRRAAYACLFSLDPNGFCLAPPVGIDGGHGEGLVGPIGVLHPVGDDAVIVGDQPGHQRPVVGKGLGREGRAHGRTRALGRQPRQRGRKAAFEIVGMETVDRHEDGDRLALLGHRGGSHGCVGIGSTACRQGSEAERQRSGDPVHAIILRR